MSYYHNQPFNDNHLRPCPMLENPEYLRKMIKQTGAKSTDLENQEGVEHLCAKCDKFAAAWKEQADKLWAENKHPNPKTQYYRDTEQAMKEKLDDLERQRKLQWRQVICLLKKLTEQLLPPQE